MEQKKIGAIFLDEEKIYLLVITEPLQGLPKMPVSLYEWSEGNGRKLIGWMISTDLTKQ
jgi:hypothetical protein